MKRPTEELLHDLLEETAPPDFQAALLEETLRHARRRKRVRRLGNGLAVAAIAGLVAVAVWRPHRPAGVVQPPSSSVTIVQSQPLRPEQVVHTQAGSLAMVETSASDRYYVEIDDRQ